MMRHVLMSSMKDEGPFVLEFVAHHRVLGFDAIHVASNDCSDGTDLLLDALAAQGAITHLPNRLKPGERPQRRAYEKMREAFDTDRADWIMALDVDEFLFVNVGAGRVGDLTALAGPEVDVISLSALSFGTSENEAWQPGRVTEQFTRRLPEKARQNAPVKSLSRGRGAGAECRTTIRSGFWAAAISPRCAAMARSWRCQMTASSGPICGTFRPG